ncbi:MAG TPA: hypothetical protein VE421_01075 [Burkholderiaceae bacterium]|nr:hypothetical protein [Burkholderiaceae bacterium]
MRVDFGLQEARRADKKRGQHMWRVVKGVIGSLITGGAGLIFGFAMGLHDARWSDAWTHVGYASSPFSAPVANGVARSGVVHNG